MTATLLKRVMSLESSNMVWRINMRSATKFGFDSHKTTGSTIGKSDFRDSVPGSLGFIAFNQEHDRRRRRRRKDIAHAPGPLRCSTKLRTKLVLCYSCNNGYNFFSFTRASVVLKRQSTFTSLPFRLFAHANTSPSKCSTLPIRSDKH